ncbi:MAG TPA: hypothetical protein VMT51_15540 [Dongiaceae bacterium]|nr:hypothetical protein [Dongiaceae bacterium]
MATDAKRIHLQLDSDPRFAAAAGGAVRYLAEAIGLPEHECREFQQDTVNACMTAFSAHNAHPHTVELCRFEDRLEVTVDPASGSAAQRLSRSIVPRG